MRRAAPTPPTTRSRTPPTPWTTSPTTEWERGYSRAEAVFPADGLRQAKYWPPVNRIDQVHGDRNLICACPPMESYQEAAE